MHQAMMKGGAVLALALLGACAPKTPDLPTLRDPGAVISSAALFDPARFAGRWQVALSGVPGCAGGAQDWAWDGTGAFTLAGTDCTGAARAMTGRAVVTGPGGRLTPTEAFGRAPVFVLWVDQDYRVAVLGTPSGGFAQVLARDLPLRTDLGAAAREVLEFNGYDLSRLGR